ncbi:MAG: nucleotidyltransferase family protein [Terriglobales bacterium]
MKAMILAAGLGTRLRPLTENRPKALVEVGGRTLLEIVLVKMCEAGIRDVIINAHHFAGMILDYLKSNQNFGMNIEVSVEDVLLDTGGGLKQAAYFLLNSRGEPFLLHNVDVISTIDLQRMVRFHTERQALATLAVQGRKTSRYLLFDDDSQLCGRHFEQDSTADLVRPTERVQGLAFCGVHVISPHLFEMISEQGAFSIITTYLRLAASGEKILGFLADEYYWRDLGSQNDLTQAAEDVEQSKIVL